MRKEKKYIIAGYFCIDVILIALCFYIAYALRYGRILSPGKLPYYREVIFLFILWAGALLLLINSRRLYTTDRSWTIPQEAWRVFVCVCFSAIFAGVMIFMLQIKVFSRLVFFNSFMFLFFSLSLWRAVKREFLRYRLAKGFYNYNVLVVGAGKAGRALVKEIETHPYLGLNVIGFFDSHKDGKVAGHDVLASRDEDVKEILQKYFVDEVYITIPSQRELTTEILSICRAMKKTVRVVADNFTLPFYRLELGHMGVIPVIEYVRSKPHGTEILMKRAFDITVSALGIVLLMPFFVVIGCLIKADSPGPVIYKSLRSGKKGKVFNFYKFRSMVEDAESKKESLREMSEVDGPIFKMKDDPRITRIGKLLRRHSLDELPQLFNVLKGDMSLVGPRPPTPDEVEKYDIWQMRRLDVRPGITCLWQVRGRSDLSFYKWIKWDLWYIDNWTFGLDFKILLWTIPSVFSRKGAY